MTKTFLFYPLAMLFALLFFACNEGENAQNENGKDIDDQGKSIEKNEKASQAQQIFYLLPSPIETASLLKKAGATYNASVLNNPADVSKYSTTTSKAINLGIYGTDLSYTSIFNQPKEEMKYVAAAKKLADDLGITNAFNEETIKRIEANVNNKDSMLNIVSGVFWTADSYLKENERENISGLIIAGGWIEGLYIATRMVDNDNPNQAIVKRVAEQKYSLEHLINLIKVYESNESLNEVLTDLEALQAEFNKIEVQKGTSTNSVNPETGVTTIGGGSELQLNEDILALIVTKIEEIRNKHIQ